MTYELLFIHGPLKDRTWTIPAKGMLRVGAGKECEISILDPAVSRYHCYVEMRDGQPWVGDLASDNGLIVNEDVVRECPLDVRDVVQIGNSAFKVMPVADKPKSSGLVKVLPWLLVLLFGGAVAALLLSQNKKAPTSSLAVPSVPVAMSTVTTVENTTNVSNVFNVVTMTNEMGVVIVRTNTVVKIVSGDAKGVANSVCKIVKPCEHIAPAATADDFAVVFGAGSCKAAQQYERNVLSNMGDMGKALAKKETTRRLVAEAAFHMADRTGMNPYQRFLYMKGAFVLYVRDIRPEEAMRTWQHIRFMLPQLDSRVAVEMFELAKKDLPNYTDSILDRALARERARVPFAAELEKLQAKLAPDLTLGNRLSIADNAAALGDWKLFARSMTSAGETWKSRIDLESRASVTAAELVQLGDFWWNRGDDRAGLVRTAYRSRAAKRYTQALMRRGATDAVSAEDRPRLESRIKTAYAEAEPAAYAGEAEYLLVDLSRGPEAAYYPVRPIAVDKLVDRKTGVVAWKDAFKTKGLVLKRIKPGILESHGMKFHVTRPFYMGVFLVTQRQYELVMGHNPSLFKDDGRKPVDLVSYDTIRGDKLGRTWPMSTDVDEQSFLGRLRRKTGLAFDLPTEIQWEYVCRAGKDGDFDGDADPKTMDKLGRCRETGGVIPDPKGTKDEKGNVKMIDMGSAVVGSYRPNAWGLYDMHGNVWEWCVDRYNARGWGWVDDGYGKGDGRKESLVDPLGSVSGVSRLHRGGGWWHYAAECRASVRRRVDPWDGRRDFGFRLACPQGR